MKSSDGSVRSYERPLKKDREVKRYFEELPKTKSKLEDECSQLSSRIDALRNDIDEKNSATVVGMPSKEEVELMKEEVIFARTSMQIMR
jgi:hypothetical protein